MIKKILFFSFWIFLLSLCACYYVVCTTTGSQWAVKRALTKHVGKSQIQYEKFEGTLAKGLTIENLTVDQFKRFPAETTLLIERVFINSRYFHPKGPHVEVDNARLRLPESEPVLFHGKIVKHKLDFTLFSKKVNFREILSGIPKMKDVDKYSGYIKDVELSISGPVKEPILSGNFFVNDLILKDTIALNTKGELDLKVKDILDKKLYGLVILNNGLITSRQTGIDLKDSLFNFDGDLDNPNINLNGESNINDVQIAIKVEGTKKKPMLNLSSNPNFPQEQLLAMLASGRSLEEQKKKISKKTMTPDFVNDFVDYFVFAGKGKKVAKKLGLRNIELSYQPTMTNESSVHFDRNLTSPGKSDIDNYVNNQLESDSKILSKYKANLR